MKLPPYPGQGEPLPPECGYVGQWIIKDRLFLCRLPALESSGEFTPSFVSESAHTCIGFTAAGLAQRFGISEDELLGLNVSKTLAVQVMPVLPRAGGTTARMFGFSDGRSIVTLVIEGGGQSGTA